MARKALSVVETARAARLGALALAMILGASCLDLGPAAAVPCVADNELGLFQGRAAGASTDSVTGCAYFGTSNPGGSGMVLTSGRFNDDRPLVKVIGPIPTLQTLVAGPPGDAGTFHGVIFLSRRRFPITAGSITKSRANAALVEGSVDVTGTDSVGVTITVRGQFLARCQEDLSDPNVFNDGPKEPRVGGVCDPNASGAR